MLWAILGKANSPKECEAVYVSPFFLHCQLHISSSVLLAPSWCILPPWLVICLLDPRRQSSETLQRALCYLSMLFTQLFFSCRKKLETTHCKEMASRLLLFAFIKVMEHRRVTCFLNCCLLS